MPMRLLAPPRAGMFGLVFALLACVPEPDHEASAAPLAQAVESAALPAAPLTTSASSSQDAPAPAPTPELQPAPAPPPPAPFAGREHVRVDELLAALSEELPAIAASDAVRHDYERFLDHFELRERALDLDELYLDYVRVKVAFEATRAGGLWGLAWDITNEQPNSELIWAAWQRADAPPVPATADALAPLPAITAIAECDELSALFAFVAQRIGLSKASEAGLFWPTGNHVVAVWTIDAKGERPVRVVVPTSQIFLDGDQSLGTAGFDPWTQKRIFDYRRQDAAAKLELPASLAAHFILRVRAEAGQSQAELQAARNAREAAQVIP